MLQKENQWFVLHFGTNHIVHKNLTIYFLSRSIFIIVSGQKRGSKPVRFSSSPHHTSEGREDIFFCAVKTGHEKSPETAWFRAFSVRYLFWSHNVVAGEGFEPTTSGLSLRAALRCPKKSSGLRFPRFFRPLRYLPAAFFCPRQRRRANPNEPRSSAS